MILYCTLFYSYHPPNVGLFISWGKTVSLASPTRTHSYLFAFLSGKISPSNAFLLPQWGGIVIHNPQTLMKDELPPHDLDAIFSSFADQLLGLLGVPSLPPSIKCTKDAKPCITDWQLDALLRRRTLENASGSQDTLLSIIKLVNQINNMPVGEDVRDDVECALSALTQVIGQLRCCF